MLHEPIVRERYTLDLSRELPRYPFYEDFWPWAEWDKELVHLRISDKSVTPAELKRVNPPEEKARGDGVHQNSFRARLNNARFPLIRSAGPRYLGRLLAIHCSDDSGERRLRTARRDEPFT